MPATSQLSKLRCVYDELVKQRQRLGIETNTLESSGGGEPNDRLGMNTLTGDPSTTTCSRSQASQASTNNNFQVRILIYGSMAYQGCTNGHAKSEIILV